MTAALFSPLELGPVRVPNRITIAPMCQYSAQDGCASDWHMQHLMTLAMSGAGLVMLEATAVARIGRITHGCLGLYSDENERALERVLNAARAVALPGTRFGIQISHAGRKASSRRPWEGGTALAAGEDAWQTVAPSAIPHDTGWHVPAALDDTGVERVIGAFESAAQRAARLGFDVIELHMAHGYLLHEFHSPLANARQDQWGGDGSRCMALLLDVARRVRKVLPADTALGARITGSDWQADGLGVEDAVALAGELKREGLSYVDVTSGGIPTKTPISVKAGYQVHLASRVRAETGIITRAVGLIVEARQADEIIRGGHADQVAIGRAVLDDPRWGWHAAEMLGVELPRPPQYQRTAPKLWPGAALQKSLSHASEAASQAA
jgi:2,4-dienoyl-CoA reductase-like NADH-dependent reductase (Old Yellow Enzyme family)